MIVTRNIPKRRLHVELRSRGPPHVFRRRLPLQTLLPVVELHLLFSYPRPDGVAGQLVQRQQRVDEALAAAGGANVEAVALGLQQECERQGYSATAALRNAMQQQMTTLAVEVSSLPAPPSPWSLDVASFLSGVLRLGGWASPPIPASY